MVIEIPDVLTRSEVAAVREMLVDASWSSGRLSAGEAAGAVKSNEELRQPSQAWTEVNEFVLPRLLKNPEFQRSLLPARVSSAFVSRYCEGMSYGPHLDDPVMGASSGRYRADVAVTVFLSDASAYSGGELRIHSRSGPKDIKLGAGAAVAWSASHLHEVLAIENGERLVCVLWVQSLVRDEGKRKLLLDLDDARQALLKITPQAQVTATIDRVYNNLIRRWAEP